MTTLVLRPLDTLFFRDGRPYNQDDPSQAEAASVFPPHPPTVVGAVRAALARAMGWPDKPWDTGLLGNGVDWSAGDETLGPLRFAGPYILRDGEPLFPAPLCLVKGREVIARLMPGAEVECDFGKVRLPIAPNGTDVKGWKVMEGLWLTANGMQLVLEGKQPKGSEILAAGKVWRSEPRVGIQRHAETRTMTRFPTEEGEPGKGALYAAAHARLCEDVSLALTIEEGCPDIRLDRTLAPLGGESRSVWLEQRKDGFQLPRPPALSTGTDSVLRYTVILVTPAYFRDEWPVAGGFLIGSDSTNLPGKVVSACVGRAVPVGGWDSTARRPLPLTPLIPSGSVWFLEANATEAGAAASWHGRSIGSSTGWGFGRVLIGRWSPAEGRT
jgi:CRISPR-associated protein Cmr3